MKTRTKKPLNITVSKSDIVKAAKSAVYGKEYGYSVVIPHLCNNYAKYVATSASSTILSSEKNYPHIETNYHLLGKNFLAKNPGYVQFIDVETEKEYNRRLVIANMICNNGLYSNINRRPINYAYLVKSMVDIKKFILTNFNSESKVKIYMPKFNSKTGANWNFVSLLMEDIWSNINVVVF
jgi:hypothetical protein